MKVIFLDIDGVLNCGAYCDNLIDMGQPYMDCHGHLFNPLCVDALKRVVEETSACIVISSSWKRGLNKSILYKEMLDMWIERNLPGEMIDCTPNLDAREILSIDPEGSMLKQKGYEIQTWLQEFGEHTKTRCSQYVIVDDEDVILPSQTGHFVQTNAFSGITEEDANKMISILNNHT